MVMTTPNPNATDNPLSDLLTDAAKEMDLPPEMRSVIRGIYQRAETYLRSNLDERSDWQVYPQGSVRLLTVTRPHHKSDYDLDVVVRSDKTKDQLTQAELKSDIGEVITGFAKAEATEDTPPTACDEGGRCWTISYPGVHVDWLPAIPDLEARQDSGILLTDQKLTRWQFGDPKAYADWFHQQSISEFLIAKAFMAREASVNVEDIPDDEVRTTLHRLAQVLKIHRNEFFAANPKFQPPSIILTHLAALSYSGGILIDELANAAIDLPTYMVRSGDCWTLENPTQPQENFADRWTDAHQQAFDKWIAKLRRDIDDLDTVPAGLDNMVMRLGESFGHDTITKAASRYGAGAKNAVAAGAVGITSSGLLTRTKPALVVPRHTFDGGTIPTRRRHG